MSAAPPRLLVTDAAALAPEVLARLAEQVVLEPLAADASAPSDGHALLVLTPEQARGLLAEPRASTPPVVLWRARSGSNELDEALLDHPAVVGVLDAASPAETVYTTLRAGLGWQHNGARAARMLEQVLDIGRALASEKDLDTLLGLILTHARELTDADGASIYTRDASGKLYFRLWQNFSTDARSSAQKTLVGDYSIAGYVARSGEVVTVDDAYTIPKSAPYQFSPAVDASIAYRTRSMLTVPLKNKADEVVGVLQLINRKDRADAVLRTPQDVASHVLPFDEQSRSVALALAGQAGVALENSILYRDIERLFEGFIRASVQAIEARDPTTAGHSFRVADFTEGLARAVDRTDGYGLRQVMFTRDQVTELRYAALLHDFGKVGVREDVLVKAKKLYSPQLEIVKQRFKYARASIARDAYRRLVERQRRDALSPQAFAAQCGELDHALAEEDRRLGEFLQIILRWNEPNVSAQALPQELDRVAGYNFPGENGEAVSLLQPFEFAQLTLAKGNLDSDERVQIESHVSHTFAFLTLIPWTKNLARLPEIAYAHHEKLDGSGYPRGLRTEQIPVQSKIMTIADIYDALTARDRPYKPALPVEKALDILQQEADAGKVDGNLLRVFVESKAYLQSS